MVGRIVTPLKDGDLNHLLPSVRVSKENIRGYYFRTSSRMGSVEKVIHRLVHPLQYDKVKRKQRLDNLFLLVNYRVRTVGISQIPTTSYTAVTITVCMWVYAILLLTIFSRTVSFRMSIVQTEPTKKPLGVRSCKGCVLQAEEASLRARRRTQKEDCHFS